MILTDKAVFGVFLPGTSANMAGSVDDIDQHVLPVYWSTIYKSSEKSSLIHFYRIALVTHVRFHQTVITF